MHLKSLDSIENNLLKKIDYKKTHIDLNSLNDEINSTKENLKRNGFFLAKTDSIIQYENKKTVYIKLNKKISIAKIKVKGLVKFIPIEKIKNFLDSISLNEEKKGLLFSETKLTNISLKNDTLFAFVNTKESQKRTINKLIIKGYPEISEKNLTNLLNIKLNNIINNEKLNKISTAIKDLNFISQRKDPEVLFKRDSTLLYLYLKKEKNNSFDGIMNFTSKEEQNGILFTGHLKLDLNNTFNRGGNLNFIWEANGEKTQNLSISTSTPNVFNSHISTNFNFKLHKQDSTFINNKFTINTYYKLNRNYNIGINYSYEASVNNLSQENDSIMNFKNNFTGLNFNYNNKKTFNVSIKPSFGIRKNGNNTEKQFKLTSNIKYLHHINNKNAVSIKNETSFLSSKTKLTNELFRIGGANSIRGFDEESIYTSKYSFINLEYHYYTSHSSYLYSISDIGIIEAEKTFGFGLGYSYMTKKSKIKLSSVIGKKANNSINLDNSKIIINFTTFF